MTNLPSDPEFTDFIRRARTASVRGLLESRGLWRKQMAGDRGVPCPACGGKDRFAVNVKKNVFTCRRSGAGGGVLALWAHLAGMERIRGRDFIEACSEVLNEDPPKAERQETAAEKMARLDRRRQLAEFQAQQVAQDEARQALQARAYRERERQRAWKFWREGAPASASPVADMLAIRAITLHGGEDLRFHADVPLWSGPPPEGRLVHRGPAMLAAICGPEFVETEIGWRRRFLGVHITWIDLADRDGKLRMPDPESGEILPAKKVIGSWKGGSIRLGGAPDRGFGPDVMIAGEGIETVLSARCALIDSPDWMGGDVTEFRSFVALDNFAGRAAGSLPHPSLKMTDARGRQRPQRVRNSIPLDPDPWETVPLLPATRELVWLVDGDSEPFATEQAVQRGARRYARDHRDLTIRLARPDPGMDFNDMLRAQPRPEIIREAAE